MKLPSSNQYSFAQVPDVNIQRSKFNRSHTVKTTFNEGYLIPIYVDEILPGDSFNVQLTTFCRLATLQKPIMDNLYLDSFFFFVPYRLVWDNFKKFMGEQVDPDDSTDFLLPKMTSPQGGYGELSIYDYMGLPTKIEGFDHCTLPLRALNLIYNEWFRDQNLQDSLLVRKTDSGDTVNDFGLFGRCKRPDYFTSCLPWPQKGDSVSLPLGTTAPIMGIGKGGNQNFVAGNASVWESGTFTGQVTYNPYQVIGTQADEMFYIKGESGTHAGWPKIEADLSNATASSINAFREAMQLQRMLERDARSGTRYIEIIRAHFNVISPDMRQQRPELLGLGSTAISVNPIGQQSATGVTGTPQGNLAGIGYGSSQSGFVKSFTEHGVVICLVMVRADVNYMYGLNRMWSRRSKYDLYWPSLAHLGEQAVLNKEIYCQGTAGGADDDSVFGYQERYAEYRYYPNQITGLFRSNAATSLDNWHLAQDFADLPELGPDFIAENAPVERVIAVETEPHFLLDAYIRNISVRPMPVYSVPGFVDHF